MSESTQPEANDRVEEDKRNIEQLLSEIGIQDVTMTSVVRLGKRIPDRHRLLKVTLDSVSCNGKPHS